MRNLIIALVGKSGSGKTTLGRYLSENLGYNWICSYTTRPMRDGETNGIDHIFVNEDDVPDKKEMMAYTVFGGYQYWTETKQFRNDVPNVYVIDEKGLVEMESNTFDVLKVYVERKDIDVEQGRKDRDFDRMVLPYEYYDIVLDNNCDLSEFLLNSANEINDIVRLNFIEK